MGRRELERRIRDCALEGLGAWGTVDARGVLSFWTQADKPFLFLAACVELTKALELWTGLRLLLTVLLGRLVLWLAAPLRDDTLEDGKHVNLTNLPEPQDVYRDR
jgi:DNA-directed RNA polymerase